MQNRLRVEATCAASTPRSSTSRSRVRSSSSVSRGPGTTHLHNLMAEDPALRSLPYWESLEPVLVGRRAGRGRRGEPDPRRERCAGRARAPQRRAPLLQAHARHDRRPRARGDPAPRRSPSRRCSSRRWRVMPTWRDWYVASRPDVAVRVPEERAAVLPVAARRRAVGAEVTAAPRAVPACCSTCSPTRRSCSPTATRSR